jgi:predicted aspartyl protease
VLCSFVAASLAYALSAPRRAVAPVCSIDLRDVRSPPETNEKVTYLWRLGNRVGFPVVRGRIASCDVTLFLDTGVSAPVLMSWFADRLDLKRSRTDASALDLGGVAGALDRVEPIQVEVPSIRVSTRIAAVQAGGDDLRSYGIAAIVPPQLAVASERIVALDFSEGTYRELASREAADALTRGRGGATFDVQSTCDGTIQVPLAIEGRPATFIIDTGSPITVLYSGSAAGQPIAARITHWEPHGTTFGGSVDHVELPNIITAMGGMAGRMWMDVWRTDGHSGVPCGFDGVLGVDFLVDRKCLLLFDLGAEAGDSGLHYPRTRGFCRP